MKRLIPAVLVGCLIACLAAVTLGEYPLTGAVPWLACLIVPAVIGTAMTAIAGPGPLHTPGRYRRVLWFATGPLAAASLAWGVSISTSWGLDPVPPAAWAEMAIGLSWPIAWAVFAGRERPRPEGQRTASSEIRPS